jgi:hypothetical protein
MTLGYRNAVAAGAVVCRACSLDLITRSCTEESLTAASIGSEAVTLPQSEFTDLHLQVGCGTRYIIDLLAGVGISVSGRPRATAFARARAAKAPYQRRARLK